MFLNQSYSSENEGLIYTFSCVKIYKGRSLCCVKKTYHSMNSQESEFPVTIQTPNASADGEFLSLVSLLDDPDVRVASAVEERLRARGASILHPLLEFIDLSADELAKRRATILAKEFNEKILLEEFATLRHRLQEKRRGALEAGVFLIARYGFPRLDTE